MAGAYNFREIADRAADLLPPVGAEAAGDAFEHTSQSALMRQLLTQTVHCGTEPVVTVEKVEQIARRIVEERGPVHSPTLAAARASVMRS